MPSIVKVLRAIQKAGKEDAKHVEMVEWFNDHAYKIFKPPTFEKWTWKPSSTTVLSVAPDPFLMKWHGDIGNREATARSTEAKNFGSMVHDACAKFLDGRSVVYLPPSHKYQPIKEKELKLLKRQNRGALFLPDQRMQVHVWRFQNVVKELKPLLVFTEQVVWSDAFNYAGTMDYLWYIHEGVYIVGGKQMSLPAGLYLVDLKTGGEYDDHSMQIASYFFAAIERGYAPVDTPLRGALVIYTNKEVGDPAHCAVKFFPPKELERHFMDFRYTHALWMRKNQNFSPTVFEFPSVIRLDDTFSLTNRSNDDGKDTTTRTKRQHRADADGSAAAGTDSGSAGSEAGAHEGRQAAGRPGTEGAEPRRQRRGRRTSSS